MELYFLIKPLDKRAIVTESLSIFRPTFVDFKYFDLSESTTGIKTKLDRKQVSSVHVLHLQQKKSPDTESLGVTCLTSYDDFPLSTNLSIKG